jgi:DNA-binding response OmpR family regulator
MPGVVLLVNADGEVLQRTERDLARAGFQVAVASTFDEGRRLLATIEPDLLIADVRLGAFNGLHLALRSRVDRPARPVIITYSSPDAVFEREASRCGARFIVAPADNPDLVSEAQSALSEVSHPDSASRRWQRTRVPRALRVKAAMAAAQVLDVSYGGLKLSFGDQQNLPVSFDVSLVETGVTVAVHRVWTSLRSGDGLSCGVEIEGDAPDEWRSFVDSVS